MKYIVACLFLVSFYILFLIDWFISIIWNFNFDYPNLILIEELPTSFYDFISNTLKFQKK